MKARENFLSWNELSFELDKLLQEVRDGEDFLAKKTLQRLVSGYEACSN